MNMKGIISMATTQWRPDNWCIGGQVNWSIQKHTHWANWAI